MTTTQITVTGNGNTVTYGAKIENGDRVEGGKGDDHDTGTILSIDREHGEPFAVIAWDSGVRTNMLLEDIGPGRAVEVVA